jgi:hypothetical protein
MYAPRSRFRHLRDCQHRIEGVSAAEDIFRQRISSSSSPTLSDVSI